MSYYYNKLINGDFVTTIEKITEELSKEGFGIISDIDVSATMKKKLDIDFRNYRILGACNPHFAHKALSHEDKIGVMLPCNVIVQEVEKGSIEVSAVNPIESMSAIKNPNLEEIATEVKQRLERAIDSL